MHKEQLQDKKKKKFYRYYDKLFSAMKETFIELTWISYVTIGLPLQYDSSHQRSQNTQC